MKVAGNSIQSYAVICPADVLPGIRNAVCVLVDVVARATGHTLPVRPDTAPVSSCEIAVATTSRDTATVAAACSRIRDDGYALLVEGARLHIAATTGRGVVYGLYALMETYLGARFYSSRYHAVYTDRLRDVPADLCTVSNPGFMSRDTFWYDVLEPQREGSSHYPYALRSNRGEMVDVGGGVSYAGSFVHTLPALAGTAHEPGVQPCLTDENTFVTVRKNVRRWLSEHPEATIISVSQNDSYPDQGGCTCPSCRAIDEREGTPMGSLLTFVNRIAEDIRADYPHVWVDTLAYRYTRKAPKTIRPADNIIIRLCSIECCFSHPLVDPSCPDNVAFRRDIEEWSAICRHLYIWDYTTDFLCYLSPFPNFAVLRENVSFFKEHHVIGVFEQGNYQSLSGEFGELRAYLLAHLLWNPAMSDTDYQALMNEFLRDYYGPGWQSIRRFIDITTEIAATRHLHIYDLPPAILPAEDGTLARSLLALFDEALAVAEDDDQCDHIRQSRIQALYYASFMPDPPDGCIPEMHAAIRAAGITHFREGGLVPVTPEGEALPNLH